MRSFVLVLFASFCVAGAPFTASADAALPNVSSMSSSAVTVYGAKWCSACKALERGLTDKGIPFAVVDTDENPGAFERARAAAGASNAIPLTSIVRTSDTVWVVGADVEAVARAHRGE